MKPFLSLLVAFGAGIASFLSPCILPLIPAYLAFITGLSIAELRDAQVRIKSLEPYFYPSKDIKDNGRDTNHPIRPVSYWNL